MKEQIEYLEKYIDNSEWYKLIDGWSQMQAADYSDDGVGRASIII